MGPQQRFHEGGRNLRPGVGHSRHDHRVRRGQRIEPVLGAQREPADRPQVPAGFLGAYPQLVPGQVAQLGPGQAEDLHHHAQLEGRHSFEGQYSHHVRLRHGWILTITKIQP